MRLLVYFLAHVVQVIVSLCLIMLCLFAEAAVAQPAITSISSNTLTVQECIDIALKNNITVRQGQLTVQSNTIQAQQARYNQLPIASFQGNQSFSSGYTINPTTNSYVQQSITSNNAQLNSSATLFNGFILKNTVRQNNLTVQASQEELQASRNTITMNVLQAYLNALTGTEQLVVAQRQADVARTQLARSERLVEAGTVPESNLYDLRATLASNELDIVTAQNTLDLAKVSLLQQMNLPITQEANLEVVPINVPDPGLTPFSATTDQLYDIAIANMPEVRGAELRLKSAALGVEVARGGLMPTLSVSGSLFTQYSSTQAKGIATGQTIQAPTSYFVPGADGSTTTVYQTVPVATYNTIPFSDQYSNNLNKSLSFVLRVPIFQGYQLRNRIATARIQQQNAELNGENIRLQLRQQIETAYTNMRASANRYRATLVQVTALERAFQTNESRFNAGAGNAIDYAIAKSNLDRSRASLISAKYDYVFRLKILDFYQNKTLTF